MLRTVKLFLISLFILSSFQDMYAQNQDSTKIYRLEEIKISGKKIFPGSMTIPAEKDDIEKLLNGNGAAFIRKGVYIAQDIYMDGFKRADVNILIDGERYHPACPNRMDAPLSRINPSDIESLEIVKTGNELQSSIGGGINLQRRKPGENMMYDAGFYYNTGAENAYDIYGVVDKSKNRLSFRLSQGSPYKNGDGKSFKDLYGFRDDYRYTLGDLTYMGEFGKLNIGAGFSYTEKVSFPYLQMDEINSKVFNFHAGYEDYKLYVNYTDHNMDNSLRSSYSSMKMQSLAKNLTVGIRNDFAELYIRNWKIDNKIEMPMMNMLIANDAVPDVTLYEGNITHKTEYKGIQLSGKAGVSYYSVGNEDRLSFYSPLYTDVKSSRFFVNLSAAIGYQTVISGKFLTGLLVDAGSANPEIEAMYIALKRAPGKPLWSGNPNLSQPVKYGARFFTGYGSTKFEVYYSWVFNYNGLTKRSAANSSYLTYENTNAAIYGINLNTTSKYFDGDISYTIGENTITGQPLAEIAPFSAFMKLKSPVYSGFNVYLAGYYNDAQMRVDQLLNERASGSWYRLDAGVGYTYNTLLISAEVSNLTSQNYARHLSFTRDPFASGVSVFEPGMSFRLSLRYSGGELF